MARQYDALATEEKWRKKWDKEKLYNVDLGGGKPKYYNLVMFPYPSGDKLHIGHWYSYAPADSWGRYMRMHGYNVFEPMGFDSFGLPAENYAIKTGTPPALSTAKNIEYMRGQLRTMGTMYDWDKSVVTSDPEYYKWTQWIFLKLYERGLAYRKKAPVNFCPSCKTVLANEQAQDGTCERCGSEVTQKELVQWFFKITDYAERLLNHDALDWPEKTKIMQKNWIGRSEGINITYDIDGLDEKITVFTTRPDTNFGATFIVIAPESNFARKNFDHFNNKKEIAKYLEQSAKKSELERISEGRKKTGVSTGLFAINNLNGRKMPIYVSDFVLANVGTGCVVGVPGHDVRDFEFAKEKELEIIRVVVGKDGDVSEITKSEQVQEEEGTMINSGFLDGMDIHAATKKIMDHIEKKGWGERVINYRLRDWLLSRQRYWGAPIPIIYCDKCGEVPVPEKDLPVMLAADVDFKPKGGVSPLATSEKFVNTKCPKCGGKAKRETDTMDTFVCSSWYFLRYPSAYNKKEAFEKKVTKKWLPVDMYVGGPEHACMHLIYARFINMALKDLGYIDFEEPFKKLVHQGMITKDGAKMSKSKGNVVSPDDFVGKYGSDVFRMYMMFMGPFEDGGDWNDQGITGIARFLDRMYQLLTADSSSASTDVEKLLHKTIKRVTEDIKVFHFNTAISALMEFVNACLKNGVPAGTKASICKIMAPLAPHFAEEVWREVLGNGASVFNETWPEFDPALCVEDMIEMVVQINGKVRGKMSVAADISKEDAFTAAKALENVKKFLDGEIVKEIFVPGKLVSFVVQI